MVSPARNRPTGATASRVSYWIAFGDFDFSLHVCHRCDRPSCVNPAHLFLGTNQDNMRDKVSKGRQSHTKGAAKLSAGDVLAIRASTERLSVVADRYGVDQSTVSLIRNRKRWADLHSAEHAHSESAAPLSECAAHEAG